MKKKNLLFTGAMALCIVGCTQTEFEQLDAISKDKGQGVAFAVSVDGETGTRAAYEPFNNVFNHKWYADKDKIGVLYKQGTKVSKANDSEGFEIATGEGWMGKSATGAFEFKATASGTSGYFVANGDDNTLWLKQPGDLGMGYTKEEMPVFRAYWPENAPLSDGKITLEEYAAAKQYQLTTDGHGIAEKAFMVSESDAKYEYDANDNSVARDRFSLEFRRVSPIVYFKIKTGGANNPNLNREYKEEYADGFFGRLGNLMSITLTAKGPTEEVPGLEASKLTFDSEDKWDMTAEDVYDPKPLAENGAFSKGTAGDAKSEVVLNLGKETTSGSGVYEGLTWSNDAVAYMTIANVDRSEYEKQGKTENMVATYTFKKIRLEKSKLTDKSWSYTGDRSQWYGFPTQEGYNLDEVPYIAYEYETGVYALEINPTFEGKLADVFKDGEVKGVAKANGDKINKSDIKHFVSKIDITAKEDFDEIKTLTALTNITLLENTTIPAEAFDGLSALNYLNLPKVTEVVNVNAFPEIGYKKVFMGSYDFSDKAGTNQTAVRDRLLKSANLVEADIAAVANIAAGFPTSGVTFTNFAQLEKITVKSGAVIGGAAFKGCTKLTTVQFPQGTAGGSVNLEEGANSQFMGCSNSGFTTISISNTVIPDLAFSGCTSLKNVLSGDGKAVVPTAVGMGSFKNCKITDMDLSRATTIGAEAFKGCTALAGNNKLNPARTVLYVNAITHVADNTFNGCTSLKYISFANAETIGIGILSGTTCTEIEFLKPFTVVGQTEENTNFFGTTTNSKLFCAKNQTGVSVNTITLKGNEAGSEKASAEFGNGITKYAK